MPISEKIIKRIEELNVSPDEKDLMKEILQIEDSGSFRFNQDYEKAIKEYIASHKDEGTK